MSPKGLIDSFGGSGARMVEERKFAGGGGYFAGAAVAYLILAPVPTRPTTETLQASNMVRLQSSSMAINNLCLLEISPSSNNYRVVRHDSITMIERRTNF